MAILRWGDAGLVWGAASGNWGTFLAGDVKGVAVVSAALSTSIRLNGSIVGQGALAAALSTGIQLSGATAGLGALSAALTTGIRVGGAVAGQGTLAGALSTAIQLGGSIAGQGASGAALSTAIQLRGGITPWVWGGGIWGVGAWGTPSGLLTADLTLPKPIAGSVVGQSAVAADLSTGVQLVGAIAGQGSTAAALGTSIRLVGAISAATWGGGGIWGSTLWGPGTQITADLTVHLLLVSAVAGQSTIALSSLDTAIQLGGAAQGQGTLAGALTTQIVLVATSPVAGAATLSTDLQTGILLGGSIAGATSLAPPSVNTAIRLLGVPILGRSLLGADFPALGLAPDFLHEGDLMAVDLGTDIGCYPGLDSSFATVSSFTLLGQDLARRFETPRGGLFYDSNYGTDIREMVNDVATLANEQKRQQQIEAEAKKDERVQRASATITFFPSSSSASVKLMVETASGPFTYVLNVTALTVALLKIG